MVHTPKFLCCLIFCAIIDAVLRCFALICICAQASSTYVPSGVPKFLWTLCIFHLHHFPRAAHRHLQYFPGFCAPQNSKLHSGLRLSPQILNLIWHLSAPAKKPESSNMLTEFWGQRGIFTSHLTQFARFCHLHPFCTYNEAGRLKHNAKLGHHMLGRYRRFSQTTILQTLLILHI